MAKKKNNKIVRYRKPLNINVGMIIFLFIFVYLAFNVYTYMGREKIQFYEVVEGGIVNDKVYTGVILRQETVKNADKSGNINYYIREGKRASVGTRVYSIDETGQMTTFLEENQGTEVNFTDENLNDLKKQLSTFCLFYDDDDFTPVYNTKLSLEASVIEYVNFNTLDNLEAAMSDKGINFQQVKTDQSGVVSYSIDSYETLEPSGISEEVFDRSQYKKAPIKSGNLVESGSPVYKIITSDEWSVMFPLSEEDVTLYGDKSSLTVKFNGYSLTSTGKYSMMTGSDGKPYGKLDFSKYMVEFVSDRFVDFEVVSAKTTGLKIPVSSVTTKNFYTVPVEYLFQGGDDSNTGFLKEVYSESGTSTVFVPATIYNSTDEYFYIDMSENSELKGGDYIVKPNSSDRFQVGPTASLEGVYNINKGYSVFKQIEVLATNGEYYIISKNMSYGLSVYDHIVLDARTVSEGELIYQ